MAAMIGILLNLVGVLCVAFGLAHEHDRLRRWTIGLVAFGAALISLGMLTLFLFVF